MSGASDRGLRQLVAYLRLDRRKKMRRGNAAALRQVVMPPAM